MPARYQSQRSFPCAPLEQHILANSPQMKNKQVGIFSTKHLRRPSRKPSTQACPPQIQTRPHPHPVTGPANGADIGIIKAAFPFALNVTHSFPNALVQPFIASLPHHHHWRFLPCRIGRIARSPECPASFARSCAPNYQAAGFGSCRVLAHKVGRYRSAPCPQNDHSPPRFANRDSCLDIYGRDVGQQDNLIGMISCLYLYSSSSGLMRPDCSRRVMKVPVPARDPKYARLLSLVNANSDFSTSLTECRMKSTTSTGV